jgi:hypothetical protein
MNKFKKIARFILYPLLGIVAILAVFLWMIHEPLPEGKGGEQAERLAEKMLESVHAEAWDSTRVLSWNFTDRQRYLWDKKRNLAEIKWGNNRVLMMLDEQSGRVWVGSDEVQGERKEKLLKKAWSHWCNDSFWFNPVVKCFDPGTSRKIVEMDDGSEGLLVTYESGGVTPGDSYLWILDENGLPKSWKLWVSVIPVGGLSFSWNEWKELSTGALVSTLHQSKLINLEIKDVKGSMSFEEHGLEGDPFQPLIK